MRLTKLSLILASGVMFIAPVARAQEPVSLAWNAPAGCPAGEAVLAEVKAILGGPTPHRVTARAEVTQLGPDHWSVHVVTDVDGTLGERTLDADSCASLANATALILAWAVDPVKARAAMAAKQPEPAPPAPASAATPSPDRTPQPASSPLPLAAVVAVSGMGDVGTLQSPGGGVQVALGALIGPLRFELSGDYWGTQDISGKGPLQDAVGAKVHLLDAGLRACFRWRLDPRFELDPCLGAGLVLATSDGYPASSTFQPAHNSGDWMTLHADLLAAWRLAGPLSLRATVGVEAPLAHPTFVVTNDTNASKPLYTVGDVGGTATLGVEAHFP
ncbi:MAG TPA: hypothetical protein VF765_12780 [Polyangiaceae bacterium]